MKKRIDDLCPDGPSTPESFSGTEWTRRDEAAADSVVAIGDETRTFCTGVAVSDELVLTARHCLPATYVRFDEHHRSAVARPVVKAVLHPDPRVDAALLIVKGSLGLPHVARRNAGEVIPPSGRLRHIGFGALGEGRQMTSSQRHPVDMFVDGWRCDTTRDTSRFGCLAGWELAVPASRGTDTCDGDSGGPLFEEVRIDPSTLDISKIPTGTDGVTCEEVCEWRLVGITSRPIAAAQRRCGDGGVYVRADRLAPWIDETTNRMFQQETRP